jgi:hypothetical protein
MLSVAVHPSLPLIACGGEDGTLYRMELKGIDYAPLIVTAVNLGQGLVIRCPVCWVAWPLDDTWLGQVIDCPGGECAARLSVNPFVAGTDR